MLTTPESPRRRPQSRVKRVWVLVIAIWAVGAQLTWIVADWDPLVEAVTVPWPLLVVMFAIA